MLFYRFAPIRCYDGDSIPKTSYDPTPEIQLRVRRQRAVRSELKVAEPVKQVLTPATSLAQHPVISDGTLVQVPPIISEGQPTALYKVAVIWPKALRAKVRASNMAWYMVKSGEVNRESTTMSGRTQKERPTLVDGTVQLGAGLYFHRKRQVIFVVDGRITFLLILPNLGTPLAEERL